MLPLSSALGELTIVSVYSHDDFPTLFSCKNEKDEFYLAFFVGKVDSSYTFLYTKIEDTDALVLLEEPKWIAPEEYYIDTDLEIYEVVFPESTITKVFLKEVPLYFPDYCKRRKEKKERFAEFLKQLHG